MIFIHTRGICMQLPVYAATPLVSSYSIKCILLGENTENSLGIVNNACRCVIEIRCVENLSPIHFVRAAKCNSGIEPQGLRLKNAWCRAPSSRSSECVHGNAIAEWERATPYSLTHSDCGALCSGLGGRAPSLERTTPGLAPRAGGDTQNVEKHCPCPTSNTLERENGHIILQNWQLQGKHFYWSCAFSTHTVLSFVFFWVDFFRIHIWNRGIFGRSIIVPKVTITGLQKIVLHWKF